MLANAKAKTKKSKHGKKNWRKNIDISDIEKSQQKLNQEKIKNQSIQNLKDQDLFEVDEDENDENQENKNKRKDKSLLGKKTKKIKKPSKQEERKIKRIIEMDNTKAVKINREKEEEEKEKQNQIYDLWGEDTSKKENKNSQEKLKYPKVPLPHPGQSYNPNKKDLNSLLTSVVENNRHLVKNEEESEENEDENVFDDEQSEEITKPVANNEPVSDINRLTKKQKRQKEIKKANKLMNRQQEEQKRIKIAINNALGAKKVAKEQKKLEEEKIKKQIEDKKQEKIKNYEIKKGIINDKELLEDFQVNKNPVPLRKIREEINPLSERWNNIMKRNMIGEYSIKMRKPKNRKLKKFKFLDIDGPIDYYDEQQDIDIVE